MMQLVGCNYRTCPLPLREKLTIAGPAVAEFLSQFRQQFPRAEAVLLSTCHRLELYTVARPLAGPSRQQAISFLAMFQGMRPATLADAFYARERERAVRHLFLVASGLDSMVLGESQILGQVKRAYETARHRFCTGSYTHGAFQAAIRTARRIARETDLGRQRLSIPRLAVTECVRHVFQPLPDKLVVVIGAGEMATETMRVLQDERAANVAVMNRHAESACSLATRFGAKAWPWDVLPQVFAQADLVITATSAKTPLVSLNDFRQWEPARSQGTLRILDLGMPRNIDPRIGQRPGVCLHTVDDVRGLGEHNRGRRQEELPRAYEIVDEESAMFSQRMKARTAGPLIQQLLDRSAGVQDRELRRLFDKLPDLDVSSQTAIRETLHRVAGKLLHPIVATLRESGTAMD